MTANETRKITNKVKEDNANSIMDKLIEESEEKLRVQQKLAWILQLYQ